MLFPPVFMLVCLLFLGVMLGSRKWFSRPPDSAALAPLRPTHGRRASLTCGGSHFQTKIRLARRLSGMATRMTKSRLHFVMIRTYLRLNPTEPAHSMSHRRITRTSSDLL